MGEGILKNGTKTRRKKLVFALNARENGRNGKKNYCIEKISSKMNILQICQLYGKYYLNHFNILISGICQFQTFR